MFAFKNPQDLCTAAPWEGFGASGGGVGMVDAEVDNSRDSVGKDGEASMPKFLPPKSVVLDTL